MHPRWPHVVILLAVGVAVTSRTTPAMTITVTIAADDLDQGPNGDCSLREALLAANGDVTVDGCTAGAGDDTIVLPPGVYPLTIHGAGEDAGLAGDLDVTSDVSIQGAGRDATIVDAGGATGLGDRLVHVHPGGALELADLTLQGGHVVGTPDARGGALLDDGGLVTLTRVTVRDSDVIGAAEDPSGSPGPGDGEGGGLYLASGSLSLASSVLSYNSARGGDLTVSAAGGGYGGGLFALAGDVSILDSTIDGNQSAWGAHGSGGGFGTGLGGGLFASTDAHVSIERGILLRNAASDGAGLYSTGSIDLSNSTVTANQATDGCSGITSHGALLVISSTIARNKLTFYGACGLSVAHLGTATVGNSIVQDNGAFGPIQSTGFNVCKPFSPTSPCPFGQSTDLSWTDALLGQLGDHGGPTLTFLPLPGSPAIDSGDPVACPATDQRGVVRPEDGDGSGSASCDRGAVELRCAGPDSDGDGLPDECDDCPATADPAQVDRDTDGVGDACDPCIDADRDGYGDPGATTCSHPQPDCNDTDPWVNPGRAEVPGDGTDNDCNPASPGCGTPVAEAATAASGVNGAPVDLGLYLIPAALAVVLWSRRSPRRRARQDA